MKWTKRDAYAQTSDCGRYSVCAIGFDQGRSGFFEAWRTRTHDEGPHLISTCLPTAAAAREICVEDSKENP